MSKETLNKSSRLSQLIVTSSEPSTLTLEQLNQLTSPTLLLELHTQLCAWVEEQQRQVADQSTKTQWQITAATLDNDTNRIKTLKKTGEYLLNAATIKSKTGNNSPLHFACLFNITEAANVLIKAGVIDLSETNQLGLTPLHLAVLGNALAIIQSDVLMNAPIKTVSVTIDEISLDCSLLHLAIVTGRQNIVSHLLTLDQYQHTLEDNQFGNALHLAVLSDQLTLLNTLLYHPLIKAKDLFNKPNREGLTPLALAVQLRRYHLMRVLMQHPAIELNAHPPLPAPLHIAAKIGDSRAAGKLLRWGADREHAVNHETAKDIANEQRQAAKEKNGEDSENCIRFSSFITKLNSAKAKHDRERHRTDLGIKLKRIENLTFRGGGGKAIAYGGSLVELAKADQKLWFNLRRVGGASAGALTALLVASGHSPEQVKTQLAQFDFAAILRPANPEAIAALDKNTRNKLLAALKLSTGVIKSAHRQPTSLWDVVLPVWKARKFKGLSDGNQLKSQLKTLLSAALTQQGLTLKNVDGRMLLHHNDTCIDDTYPVLENNLGLITFGQLRKLITSPANQQHAFKHLYITTTCITGQQHLKVFHSENSHDDDAVIIDAIAASMTYPFAFEPQPVRRVNREGGVSVSTNRYVDGGLLMNNPVQMFDRHGFIEPHDTLGCKQFPRYNKGTIGLTLTTTQSPAALNHDDKTVDNILDLIKLIGSFFLKAEVLLGQAYVDNDDRCLQIDDCGVTVKQVTMTDGIKAKLQASGKQAADTFLKRFGLNIPDAPAEEAAAPGLKM